MSYSWNHWACIVDDEREKKNKELEKLERQNIALLERVERLEDEKESLKRKVEWLCEMKMNEEIQLVERKRPKVQSESSYATGAHDVTFTTQSL